MPVPKQNARSWKCLARAKDGGAIWIYAAQGIIQARSKGRHWLLIVDGLLGGIFARFTDIRDFVFQPDWRHRVTLWRIEKGLFQPPLHATIGA